MYGKWGTQMGNDRKGAPGGHGGLSGHAGLGLAVLRVKCRATSRSYMGWRCSGLSGPTLFVEASCGVTASRSSGGASRSSHYFTPAEKTGWDLPKVLRGGQLWVSELFWCQEGCGQPLIIYYFFFVFPPELFLMSLDQIHPAPSPSLAAR